MDTQRYARTLESSALHLLRRQVVQAAGCRSPRRRARLGQPAGREQQIDREGGLQTILLKRLNRPSGGRHLTRSRAARIQALIVGKMPDQLKLPFYLWTRAAGASLIQRTYGIAVLLRHRGSYLKA
jgi:hypothetical protein